MQLLEPQALGVVEGRAGEPLTLLAGQLYFGRGPRQVSTLLGSCVAVTLWHARHRIGGMCHFLLPTRTHQAHGALDARFGDEAMALLADAVARAGTQAAEYEAHLYGGADTLSEQGGQCFAIGERNIEQGWGLIEHYGFALQAVDVGEHVPRHVQLSLIDGQVQMRRGEPHRPAARTDKRTA